MKLELENNPSQLTIDFSEYLDGLYSYAVVLSRNRTEAEDLVQETCLRALRAMERLRPDSNIKSWLFTILRNIWLNQVRQSQSVPQTVELDVDGNHAEDPASTAKDPFAEYVSNFEQAQVRTAIRQLPLEFREIIILREYEDLSYEQIASLLNCPIGTVMSRLARARLKLRDLLPVRSAASPSGRKSEGDANESVAWDQAKIG